MGKAIGTYDKNSKIKAKGLYLAPEREYELRQKNIDAEYLKAFASDAGNFINSIKDNPYVDSAYDTWASLNERYGNVRDWLIVNRSKIGEDNYNKLSEGFSAFDTLSGMYGQYGSAEEFSNAAKTYEEIQAVLNAEDFQEFSEKGGSVSNPSYDDSTENEFNLFGWKPFGEGKKINNMVTFADDNLGRVFGKSAQGLNSGGTSGEVNQLLGLIATEMTDEEKSIYNYYIGKGETKKAEEYLSNLTEVFKQRQAGKIVKQVDGKGSELLLSALAGLGQFASGIGNLDNLISGNKADPTTTLQYAQSAANNNNEGAWKVANDLISTTSNMLPSILISTIPGVGKVLGTASMGLSAAGNAYAEMRNLGYDENQARAYGALIGASEATLQYFLGGISKLGGGKFSANALITKFVGQIDNAFARTAIKLGGNMLSEGLEESIQSVLEPVFKSISTGEELEGINWEEVMYSGLLGAMSAGLLEGAPTVVGEVNTYKQGKKIKESGTENVDRLKKLGSTMSADSVAHRLASKVNENTGAYTVGRLLNEVGASLSEQNKADIKKSLERKGITGKDAAVITKWLNKAVEGGIFTKSQRDALENNEVITTVFKDVIINQNSTVNQRIGEYNELGEIASGKKAAKASNDGNSANAVVTDQVQEAAQEGSSANANNATSGNAAIGNTSGDITLNGRKIELLEVASVKDGVTRVSIKDGTTVDANDVDFGNSSLGILYKSAIDMGLNAATANAFIRGYDAADGLPAFEYALGFKEAYTYGKYGYPADQMTKDGFSALMSEESRRLAYQLGESDARYSVQEKQDGIKEKTVARKSGDGSMSIKEALKFKGLNDTQRSGIEAAKVISEALGIKIRFFTSKVKDGRRVGENGRYDPKTGTIYIDVYAGIDGEGVILFTLAHELTHHIREWSPVKFKAFADFLFAEYGKAGKSVEALVKEQIAKAKRNGREISYDVAYEEVVADSCMTMLNDGKAIEKIAKLKAQDKGLWNKIKNFITGLVNKIKAAYKGVQPYSQEGIMLSEALGNLEQLQEMWTEALIDAGDAYSEAVSRSESAESSDAEGEVLYDARDNVIDLTSDNKLSDLVNGVYGSKRYNLIKEYILKELENQPITLSDGKKAIVDKSDAQHISANSGNKKVAEISHIREIIETAKFVAEETSTKDKKFDYFWYYEAQVKYDSDIFPVYVNVGRAKNDATYHVYDLTQKIRETAHRVNDVERPVGNALKNDLSNNRIAQNDENVNTSDEELYSERDYPIDTDVKKTVNAALGASKSSMHVVSEITPEQNKAINRLVNQTKNDLYRGKFTGGKHRFSDTAIKHIISEHGDFLREGLRAQLPMTPTDIARHLSAIKDNKAPSTMKPTKTAQGNPSILTSYEVNGYTLYAEEITKPLGRNLPSDLIGHTMYKAPTLSTAAALATSARTLPRRQSQVLYKYYTPNGSDLSIANFVTDINGNAALLSYITENNAPKSDQLLGALIPLSYDSSNFTDTSGNIKQGYVHCKKPFYITTDNRVFSNSETDVAAKINELKKQGYDCFIFDKVTGDNYMVAVVNKAQIVENIDSKAEPEAENGELHSDRDFSYENFTDTDYYTNGKIYSYDFLIAQKDMIAVELPKTGVLNDKRGKIDDDKVVSEGIKNALSEGSERDGKIYVKNTYTGRELRIDNSTIKHGLDGTYNRLLTNARIGSVIGSVVKNAIPINGLRNTSKKAVGTYAMVAYCNDVQNREFIAVITVEQHTGNVDSFELYDVAHAVSGRQKKSSQVDTKSQGVYPIKATTISIADLIQIVNSTHQSILSIDVLNHLGETRNPNGSYTDKVLFSDRDSYDEYSKQNAQQIISSITYNALKFNDGSVGKIEGKAELADIIWRKLNTTDYQDREYAASELAEEVIKRVTVKADNPDKAMYADTVKAIKPYFHSFNLDAIRADIEHRYGKNEAKGIILAWGAKKGERGISADSVAQEIASEGISIEATSEADIFFEIYELYKRASEAVKAKTSVALDTVIPKDERAQLKKDIEKQILDGFRILGRNAANIDPELNEAPRARAEEYLDLSNRGLLINALEGAVQNDIEYKKLTEYKSKLGEINKLQERKNEITAMLFDKNAGITGQQRKELQFELRQISNRIGIYDKQLLNLEATKALKALLEREKAKAYKAAEQRGREAIKAERAWWAERQKDLRNETKEARARKIEGRRKTEMRQKIKLVVNNLNHLLLFGTKERNIKAGLQEAVAMALDAINFDTVGAEKRIARLNEELKKAKTPEKIQEIVRKIDNIQNMGDKMTSRLKALKEAYEEIASKGDSEYAPYFKNEANLIIELTKSTMEVVGDTPLREMSLRQLTKVHDLYSMILRTIQLSNKIWRDGKALELDKEAEAIKGELRTSKPLSEERTRVGEGLRDFKTKEYTPYYAFASTSSAELTKYYLDLVEGQNVYARDIEEAKAFASETRKKYGYSKWDFNKVYKFTLKDGRRFELTLKHLLSIYAYSRRSQSLEHMRVGGFFYDPNETFRKKLGVLDTVKDNEVGYRVDLDILLEMTKAMTEEQIRYVEEMQQYLTDLGAKGNEVTQVMWGIDVFKESVYFPLVSVEDFIARSTETAGVVSLKNSGMTKETKIGANNPIVLEGFDDVWASHVEKMCRYHGFVLPIDNLNKVLHYGKWSDANAETVTTVINGRFGKSLNNYFEQFITDLNGGVHAPSFTHPLAKFIGKMKKTAVGISLSTIVQQPTAIIRATSELNPKYFVSMPKFSPTQKRNAYEEMKKYAPIAVIKEIGGFDAGSGGSVTGWLNEDTLHGVNKAMKVADDVSMWGASKADEIGWLTIWAAVKREIKATTDLQYGSEEFLKKAGERFTEIIVKTQVYDSTLSRNEYMRSKNEYIKMLSAFMGEPTLSLNMIMNAVTQVMHGKMSKRHAARVCGSVFASTVAASLMASLIYALNDDDEDESYAEKYMQALGGKLASELNPLNMLIGVRDIVSIFDGWSVERTDVAIFQDLYNAFNGLFSESKSPWRKVEDFAGAIGAMFGLPVKNLIRTARQIINAVKGYFIGGETFSDLLEEFWEAFLDGSITYGIIDKFIDS